MYAHIHGQTCIWIYARVFIYVCVREVLVGGFVYTSVCVCVKESACVGLCASVCVRRNVCMSACMCLRVCVRVCQRVCSIIIRSKSYSILFLEIKQQKPIEYSNEFYSTSFKVNRTWLVLRTSSQTSYNMWCKAGVRGTSARRLSTQLISTPISQI